jgi:dTDP-4-dehydrorhamnose 3,5-epimerase
MKIKTTDFEGLIIITPNVYADSRGYFLESFNQEVLRSAGIDFIPVQDNESKSAFGVIRGLHYQLSPHDQAKLIRVIDGKIYDVALDLRKKSPTFGKWFGIELDSESKQQVLIPRGFAHGFSVLSKTAVIQYKCDNTYNKQNERGILLNDPALKIDWKIEIKSAIVSEKDINNPVFEKAEYNF